MNMDDLFSNEEEAFYKIKLFKNINRIEEAGVMKTRLQKINDEMIITNETELYIVKQKVITSLTVRKKDFFPIDYISKITTPQQDITLTGKYKTNSVLLEKITSQGKEKKKLSLPKNYYDSTILFFVLRAMTFHVLNQKIITTVNLSDSQTIDMSLEHSGEERVQTPRGEVDCIGIKLSFVDFPQAPYQKYLYQKNPPYFLIKNIAGPQIIEIMY